MCEGVELGPVEPLQLLQLLVPLPTRDVPRPGAEQPGELMTVAWR